MLSFFGSVYSYFFPTQTEDESSFDQETFLAQELLNLELDNANWEYKENEDDRVVDVNKTCFQRTGVVTFVSENEVFFLIDGTLYVDFNKCSCQISLNDKVCYLGYKESDGAVKVTRILENLGPVWVGEDVATGAETELKYEVFDHVIIGEVDYRENRSVFIKGDNVLEFNLDDVEATFVPLKGDWLELRCSMQWNEDNPAEVSTKKVLKVKAISALRCKVKSAVVTYWGGEDGVCDGKIFFSKQAMQSGCEIKVGTRVYVEAIESNQASCTWRATKMMLHQTQSPDPIANEEAQIENDEEKSLEIEEKKNIQMTHPLAFQNVQLLGSASLTLDITNHSMCTYIVNKWMVLSRKADSQIRVAPFLSRPRPIKPGETLRLYVTCEPKFVGKTREVLVIACKGFFMKRFIDISIQDGNEVAYCSERYMKKDDLVQNMKNILKSTQTSVPGVRPVKPPAFVPVKLGVFSIPQKVWAAVLGDSDQTIHGRDYDNIINRIESVLPTLSSPLNIHNYTSKWHTLLYTEEIQQNISMRNFDMPKTFLANCGEYLSLEIKGLSEKRPSLIAGDKVIARDIWDKHGQSYEGFIHVARGDTVLLKFNPRFHEVYSGSDVALEFHSSRTAFRRGHQAINLALAHLGPDLLFPTKVNTKAPQITKEKLQDIKWYNPKLNEGQKAAVTNILLGECRPMPYCIYGPPGTGKTITVIETILQILSLLPDSRILVAAPSNSAANLITERLLSYRDHFSQSMVRLIANHLLQSDNIPDAIKPFCATQDIARENTSKSKYRVNEDGINLHCQSSFIGRHRVTIGTCNCLGVLAQMGLPHGHFTHIIVDEAGQATEPEILIPMTFTDSRTGQIILAGDPMQLGPVVMSQYAKEFGLDESYFSRILERFPYQKDFDAFKEGFDRRLVTRLNFNYRSLEEILCLPSKMFYDGILVPKLDRKEPWIEKLLDVVSDVIGQGNRDGGIYVCGIRGSNARAEDCPSWYNPQEASMIALTTCKLYKRGVSPDDIGIIAPYIAQIKHLRLIFDAMGLAQPKIGTVEEFQGQERPIILISTVRSTECYLESDLKHTLGFVSSPKRLNVALTRAQVAVFLFCNPHLLCKDLLWEKVISQAVNENKYSGCNLPPQYERLI